MNTFYWTAIAVELIVGILAGLWFVAAYATSPWGRSAAGRHMMAVSVVMVAEMAALLLVLFGVPVPGWLFVLGYAVADAVVIHRLLLLHRVRQDQ